MHPGQPRPCADGAAAPTDGGSRDDAAECRPSVQPAEHRIASQSSAPDRPAATAPHRLRTALALAEPTAPPLPSAPLSAAAVGPDAVDQKVRSDPRRCSD